MYGYDDDPYRFAFFSRAALDYEIAARGWRPDVVHAHDWHAAPAVWWLATAGNARRALPRHPDGVHDPQPDAPGARRRGTSTYLGHRATAGLREEPYGGVNCMARGIFHATMVNTVSPTYAREIMTPEGGCGLDGLLRHRHFDLHGVLNGLDYDVWNPSTDRHLAARVRRRTRSRRARRTSGRCRRGWACRSETTCRWWRW